jgi:hypothetical protein
MSLRPPKPCENPYCKKCLYPGDGLPLELGFTCPYCEQPQLEEFADFVALLRVTINDTKNHLTEQLFNGPNPGYSQLLEQTVKLGKSLKKLEMTYNTLDVHIISEDSPALNAFRSEWRGLLKTFDEFTATMGSYPEFVAWHPLPPHIIY